MSIGYPDRIRIIPVIRNTTFRTESSDNSIDSDALVEQNSKIAYGSDGQPTRSMTFIMIPATIKTLAKGDRLQILELQGETVEDHDPEPIEMVFKVGTGMGRRSHWEVMI